MKTFLEPLRTWPLSLHVRVWGGLALISIYLYPGHRSFFLRTWGAAWEGNPFADWAAAGWQHGAAFLLLGLLPLAWILVAHDGSLRESGFCLGDWRFGLKASAVAAAVLAVPLWVTGGDPAFQAEYPLAKAAGSSASLFQLWELTYLVYYLAWEFFFRGFWQLGLERSLGVAGALCLEVATSTVMHIGKPMGETLAAIVGGLAFGLLAVRTRSFLYPLLIHWYVGMSTDFWCIVRSP